MAGINPIPFHFDSRIGMLAGIRVGCMDAAVSLNMEWKKLPGVIKSPNAPDIGIMAQSGILLPLPSFQDSSVWNHTNRH